MFWMFVIMISNMVWEWIGMFYIWFGVCVFLFYVVVEWLVKFGCFCGVCLVFFLGLLFMNICMNGSE